MPLHDLNKSLIPTAWLTLQLSLLHTASSLLVNTIVTSVQQLYPSSPVNSDQLSLLVNVTLSFFEDCPFAVHVFRLSKFPTEPSIHPDGILDRSWLHFSLYRLVCFLTSDPPSPLIPLPFVCDNTSHRSTRELSQTLSKFHYNLIYNSTAPFLLKPTLKIFILSPSFVNIMTLTYTTLTHILLLKILMNLHFIFLSLLP